MNVVIKRTPHFSSEWLNFGMASHRAKCSALRKCSNKLRRAINADLDNLSSELCAQGLISEDVRDTKDAGNIVSSIQNRLSFDESAWDLLIKVLADFKECAALVDQLKQQLAEEMSGQGAHGDRAPQRQQQNGSGLCIGCCKITQRLAVSRPDVSPIDCPSLLQQYARAIRSSTARRDSTTLWNVDQKGLGLAIHI